MAMVTFTRCKSSSGLHVSGPVLHVQHHLSRSSPKYDHDQEPAKSQWFWQIGEAFSGPWQMVYIKSGNQAGGATTTGSANMAVAWDAVYGQGFCVAHILGANRIGHIALTVTQGTVLQIEWWDQSRAGDGTTIVGDKGIGQDSKGNIYKLAW